MISAEAFKVGWEIPAGDSYKFEFSDGTTQTSSDSKTGTGFGPFFHDPSPGKSWQWMWQEINTKGSVGGGNGSDFQTVWKWYGRNKKSSSSSSVVIEYDSFRVDTLEAGKIWKEFENGPKLHVGARSDTSQCTLLPLSTFNRCPGSVLTTEATDCFLDRCEGDCDSDNDCLGNLRCFQREGKQHIVPGCTGINNW
jgi:hypothetical protein